MSVRRTTVRRLAILLAGALLLVAIGTSLYMRNEHLKAKRLAAARAAGLAAFKAGDYRTALDQLKTYTWRVPSDTEALYAYGISRSRIETPSDSYLTEGINALSTLLQQDPTNLDAQHALLDLYARIGRNSDVLDLAESVLDSHPNDPQALRAKCDALIRLRKEEQALGVSQKINELDPTNLDQQWTTFTLLHRLGHRDAELIAKAQDEIRKHPGDPRFTLLLAVAYSTARDFPHCVETVRIAATQPVPDASYVRHMIGVLDELKMYKESQDLLDRAVAQNPDPQIMRVLIQRLWQSGKFTLVIDRLNQIDVTSPSSDTGLLAYLALSDFETGDVASANKIVNTLASRKSDNEAMGWSTALAARFNRLEPKAAIGQYEAALVRSPDNPVIRYLIGEAYARMGETELAIASWGRAKDLSPSWMAPHLSIARALAATGRTKEALAEADAACRAAPDQPAALTTLALLKYKALDQGPPDPAAQSKLLSFVADIQKAAPGESETLPVYVSLLAREGKKTQAIDVLHQAIVHIKNYDQATILRLVAASKQFGLGLEDELQNSAPAGDASNPRVALARAAELAASGKQADGLALLQNGAKKATTQPVQWQLAIAQFKEIMHDPAAAKTWIDLAEANPDDLAVQTAVLKNANSVRSDRDFVSRTIDRLKNLTGSEAQTWKLERARWLIGSGAAKDAAEAVNTLSEIVRISPTLTEARLLLAAGYEAVGNLTSATKELQQAADQDPTNDAVAVELARLLQSQNKFADAKFYLDRAAQAANLSDESRMRLASMLAAQGELARAATILEGSKDPSPSSRLVLADLYRHQGRAADAEAIYTKLLAAKPPSIDAIRAAADFYGAQHRTDVAEKVLARVPETNPRPGMSELAIASYNERWGSAEVAQRKYVSAAAAAPDDPNVWRNLIEFHLRNARFQEAQQAADDALHALPDDASLNRLKTMATQLSQLAASKSSLRPMLTILAQSPDDRGVVELLEQPDSTSQPTGNTMLAKLRDVATRYPRSLALQMALVQAYVSNGRLEEAAWFAGHTMESFPNDADSARIAAAVYQRAGRTDIAIAAAQQWRARAAENPEPADLTIAELDLARNDPNGALAVLSPYVAQIKSSPQENIAGMTLLVRAHALAEDEKEAHDLMLPLLKVDKGWRVDWLEIAGKDLTDAAAAKRWIHEVEPLLKDDIEKLAMAEAWYRLSMRSNDPAALDNSAKVLDPLIARPQPSVDALLLRAMVADRAGDPKSAEVNYRRVLKLDPDNPDALNNLAYTLLINGGDVSEAKSLASKAVAIAPTNASYFDTLARVQLKANERDSAIAAFRKAIDLDPRSLEALIGLAGALLDAGQRDAATPVMTRIDELMKSKPAMPAPLRRELETVRSTAKASL